MMENTQPISSTSSDATEKQESNVYSLEVASNSSQGVFRIEGKHFKVVALKVSENKTLNNLKLDSEFCLALTPILNKRQYKKDEPLPDKVNRDDVDFSEVTADFLEDTLTGFQVGDIVSLLSMAGLPKRLTQNNADASQPQGADGGN